MATHVGTTSELLFTDAEMKVNQDNYMLFKGMISLLSLPISLDEKGSNINHLYLD